jgi:hypothetical protein
MIEIGTRDNSDSTVPNPGVKELQTPGCSGDYILHGVASYSWVLSKKLASCQRSGAYTFEVAPKLFLEICAPYPNLRPIVPANLDSIQRDISLRHNFQSSLAGPNQPSYCGYRD